MCFNMRMSLLVVFLSSCLDQHDARRKAWAWSRDGARPYSAVTYSHPIPGSRNSNINTSTHISAPHLPKSLLVLGLSDLCYANKVEIKKIADDFVDQIGKTVIDRPQHMGLKVCNVVVHALAT